MNFKNLEVLFNKSRNLYCFIDMNTYNLIYVNNSFCKFFDENQENLINKKYHNILFNSNIQEQDCILEKQGVLDQSFEYYEKIKDVDFKLVTSFLDIDGHNICVCKLTKSHIVTNKEFSNAMLDCIDIIKSEDPYEETIDDLLKIIVEYYDSDGCYICTINKEMLTLKFNNVLCLRNDIQYLENATKKITKKDLQYWNKVSNETQHIIIDDIETEITNNTQDVQHLINSGISSLFATPIKNGNDILGFILITNPRNKDVEKFLFYSITLYIKENLCRMQMLNQLQKAHNRDPLTGFLNRMEYNLKLNAYVESPPEQLGIIFCDINGLRKTNSDFGYEQGDKKISQCTHIMKEYFDYEFYRIGGDEFLCFIEDLDEDEFYLNVSRLRDRTQNDNKAAFSVGCTWRCGDKISVKQVADADNMMYLNKQKYYQNAVFSTDTSNIDLLQDLLKAIKNDEFQVYLQPKIHLETDSIIGAEALVRRYDSEKGKLIFPDQFIPLYENKAIIRHVDLEVLRKVCVMQKNWLKHGKSLKVSVNFSRITLKEDDIVKEIVQICDEHDIPHELIMVEITERIGLLDDADVSDNLISELVLNGFNLSLDDFGCAYSNIVTLSKIDVNEVKIDKSLVDFIETNKKNQIIVRNIIDMCNEMDNTDTVSEGIETQEQANLLKEFRCKQGQGFLYSRPIPAMDFYNKYIIN